MGPNQLSWNQIRENARQFSETYQRARSEKSEAQKFLLDFFRLYGLTQTRILVFEKAVDKINGRGYIDLFWEGTLIVEMKSAGEDLDKAFEQAQSYCHGLAEYQLPRYIMVSDFQRIRLYDLRPEAEGGYQEIALKDLAKRVEVFGFILGREKKLYIEQEDANIRAAELLGQLHDSVKNNAYTGRELEILLVRILFCLFADNTGIFLRHHFRYWVEHYTHEDGHDLGPQLIHLFQVLNTPEAKRSAKMDEDLRQFPYVNGQLFQQLISIPTLDTEARQMLLACCQYDWSKISPAIFGTLFQSAMDPYIEHFTA